MTTTSPATVPSTTPPAAPRPAWWGALDGVVAGLLTVGLATLAASLLTALGESTGQPAPIAAVSGAFIDRTPPWLKDFAIATFGTNDKRALLAGTVVVLSLACASLGVLAARRLVPALVAFAVLGAVGAAAVLSRPAAGPLDVVPTVLGTAAGVWFLSRAAAPAARVPGAANPGRRWLIGGAVGAVAAYVGGYLSGDSAAATVSRDALRSTPLKGTRLAIPDGADLKIPGLTPYIVPNAEFYRIDTAIVVPRVDANEWRLTVTGMVDREVEIDWKTLQSKQMQEALVTLTCVSNEVGGDLIGNAVWTGWPVRELLRMAGPKPGADMVLQTSIDGFTASTPLAALTDDRNALLAIRMNGEPLPFEHGFPVRVVVPGLYGFVSATKWVTELKVTTYADDVAYWTPRGWSPTGPIKTASRIDVPKAGAVVKAGKVAVAGVAWHQHTGISKVEVQVDQQPWAEARLAVDASIDTWRQWVYEWDAAPGSHDLRVRAYDASGEVQSPLEAPPAPDGATGIHVVNVRVE
ncbi:molybdopterin-dependent oxidoreductase [Terrabacter sp. MAHUQ-38]|uniref:molybdopterin-dependent oxidoreductase n=1 Tax=unclassified Terrabacter TaxID=2630222 RepID=UPI00165E7E9F|nr:molybdopterin-dependent oxidoreductase [Terrabacter sp. MAHUQ-38]MBC9822800.1 molybdopterin-dependent oxidoreductase [Terrabacter sp. MAHUQ-38]